MDAFPHDLFEPGSIYALAAFALLIAAMLMRDMRKLRLLALLAGLAGIAHYLFAATDTEGLGWLVLFVLANGGQLAFLQYGTRRRRFFDEERELLEQVLRVEEPSQQRRLLDLIEWRDCEVGEILMTQGQANPPLIYVASGAAAIEHDGQLVGVCGPGDFLGEMSLVTGDVSSASVAVTNPVRIARFDHDSLLRLSRALPELARAFDHAINRGLAAKILRMNQAATTPQA